MADLLNNCRFTAGSTGTGDFADGTADPSFQNLEDAGAVDGKVYPYKAANATGTEWEYGYGTALDTSGGWVLERTSIEKSSNSGSAVNFTTQPKVVISAGKAEIGSADIFDEPGAVLQSVVGPLYTDNANLTTQIPGDASLPLSSEGTRILTSSIKLKSPNNRILAEFRGQASAPSAASIAGAIFLDNDSGAVAARFVSTEAANRGSILDLDAEIIPADVNKLDHDVHVNVGPTGAVTIRMNGTTTASIFQFANFASLRLTEIAGELFTWGGKAQSFGAPQGNPQFGFLDSQAPGLTSSLVIQPNGSAPTEGDLLSHRYHHSSAVGVIGGRIWVAFSSSGTNEDAGGQMSVARSSLISSMSWGSPVIVAPPQSTFSGTGASYEANSRVTGPFAFFEVGGLLYLVMLCFDIAGGPGSQSGAALFARECKADGTVGPLFRITPETYTPNEGFAAVNYDAVLGPPLLAKMKMYGNPWVGAGSPWIVRQGSGSFGEPGVVDINGDGQFIVRLFRKLEAPGTLKIWAQHSRDGGQTWSAVRPTDLPNDESAVAAAKLPDGRFIVIANLPGSSRDPLYLAIFDAAHRIRTAAYYIKQNVPDTPVYPGSFKGGGPAYPGVWVTATDIWVAYSLQKENIELARIPLSGL